MRPFTGTLVYILRSVPSPTKFYVGKTNNLTARIESHNAGNDPATRRYRPWRLHATFWFADETTAIRFERYLKTGSGRAFARRHF